MFGASHDAIEGKHDGGHEKDNAIVEDGEAVIDDPVVVIDDSKENAMTNRIVTEMSVESEISVVDDNRWKWGDAEQVIFREVERIDVNDLNAAKTVKDARINGTPVVLVGHVGWANFTKRWLTKKKDAKGKSENQALKGKSEGKNEAGVVVDLQTEKSVVTGKVSASEEKVKEEEQKEGHNNPSQEDNRMGEFHRPDVTVENDFTKAALGEATTVREPTKGEKEKEAYDVETNNYSSLDNLLDLFKQNYELDVNKMIKDIGEEDVPVIKRHYNEVKPIHGKIAAEKFLTSCWPTSEPEISSQEQDKTPRIQRNSNLYLHQWQFPLSDTAGRKLCHQNNALPNGIMGEDLLKYWLDLPQCKLDSPLQYIFMGREDTLSKLHRDPGGLAISIAPIVGHKECVLVHRSDGSNCLYHLTASLKDIDLQRHPLLSQARTWRTVIQPGEILLMPHGTYHQVRFLDSTYTKNEVMSP